jgi:hypothetical protein
MFQYGAVVEGLRIEHQHADGSWATMVREDDEEHADPADHDPEREWLRGHVYVCRSCGERVRVSGRPTHQVEASPA